MLACVVASNADLDSFGWFPYLNNYIETKDKQTSKQTNKQTKTKQNIHKSKSNLKQIVWNKHNQQQQQQSEQNQCFPIAMHATFVYYNFWLYTVSRWGQLDY